MIVIVILNHTGQSAGKSSAIRINGSIFKLAVTKMPCELGKGFKAKGKSIIRVF